MKKIIFPLLLSLGFFWSCESTIDIELPESDPVLVVSCQMVKDSVLIAQVSRSMNPLEQNYDLANYYISNASVILFVNGTQAGTFQYALDGYYYLIYSLQEGDRCSLSVSATGYDAVSALDTMPYQVPIHSFSIEDSAIIRTGEQFEAEITFSINDPAGISNYYALSLFSIDTFVDYYTGDTTLYNYQIYFQSNDPLFEEQNSPNYLFTDETFSGQNRQFKFQISQYYLDGGKPLFLELSSISRAQYKYTLTYYNQIYNEGNPFAEPAPVFSNIEGGLGIFAARTKMRIQIQ